MTNAFRSTYTTALGYTPVYRIEKAGEDITSNFQDRATLISVTSVSGGGDADRLDLSLDDRDFALSSPVTAGDGAATLQVSMGYLEGGLYDMGTFAIDRVRYSGMPRMLRLIGSSVGFDNASKSPLITSYDGKTLGDIVSSIAQSAGVSPSIDESLASKRIPYLNQHQSSIHLLQELERRYDGLAKFSDGYLSFTRRGTGDNASGAFAGGFVLKLENLASWDVDESQRTAFTLTRASYWDKADNELKWTKSGVAGAPNASFPYMIKRAYNSQDEAQSAADAQQGALNRGVHSGSLTLAKGDPSIRGGMAFSIQGVRDGVDGYYTVTQVTHSFDKETGISTSLDFEDPGSNFGGALSSGTA